jgi:hypothetical protein
MQHRQASSKAVAAGSAHFDLVSHWRLPAPVDEVWSALTQPETWPAWWPYVRSVHTLRAGAADGLGAVRRVEWATRLPYRVRVEIEVVRGEGLWLLRPQGGSTNVTYLWRVELRKPWMRALAPVLASVFRWNHDGLMRAGGAGLARYLAEGGASPRGD